MVAMEGGDGIALPKVSDINYDRWQGDGKEKREAS